MGYTSFASNLSLQLSLWLPVLKAVFTPSLETLGNVREGQGQPRLSADARRSEEVEPRAVKQREGAFKPSNAANKPLGGR